MTPRRSSPPLWFTLCVAAALAVGLRALDATAHGAVFGAGRGAPVAHAFLGFLILIGQLLWKGLEVAGRVTLEVVHWMVVNLAAVVAKIGNGLREFGLLLRSGVKKVWEFFETTYERVIKPAVQKLWRWFTKFTTWLDDTFGPVLRWLKRLRDNLLLFYKTFVRPWLDLIDVTRKLLRVLASLGLSWARALDKRLADIESAIERPFRLVLSKLNEVIGIVNRVITLDGLVQRVALVRSIERDYVFAWRAIVNPWRRDISAADSERARKAWGAKTTADVVHDVSVYLLTGGGPDAPIIHEQAAQWRIYLRS
jgi:hypothetical protein